MAGLIEASGLASLPPDRSQCPLTSPVPLGPSHPSAVTTITRGGWNLHLREAEFLKPLLLLVDQGQGMVTSHMLSLAACDHRVQDGDSDGVGLHHAQLTFFLLLLSQITASMSLPDFPILPQLYSAQQPFIDQAIPIKQTDLPSREAPHQNQKVVNHLCLHPACSLERNREQGIGRGQRGQAVSMNSSLLLLKITTVYIHGLKL